MNSRLGIDTSGTYTDAVIIIYDDKNILATHKSLATAFDLSIGIDNVISARPSARQWGMGYIVINSPYMRYR